MNITVAAKKAAGYLALALLAIMLAGTATKPAQAVDWEAQQTVVAPDGTSRVLWTANTPSGRVAGIWKLDANGNKVGNGPVYGPYTSPSGNWYPFQLAVAHDGTCRLLWFAYSSQVGSQGVVWTLDSNGNATSTGTVYGPYSDANGFWQPTQIGVASDGTTRMLWQNTNLNQTGFEAIIWKLDSSGRQVSGGAPYGPYYGTGGSIWRPAELLVASDGTSRLLWAIKGDYDANGNNYSGDTVTVWRFDGNGIKTVNGPAYGPYPGWGVVNMDVNTSDSTLRMLWQNFGTTSANGTYSGDIVGLWSLDANGTQTLVGPSYGRYPGWSAGGVAALPDGTSRVEWEQDTSDGNTTVVGLWGFDSSNRQSFVGPTYGPFDGWTLQGFDINRTDNSFRLLWTHSDDAAGVWSVNSSGVKTSGGTVYGPYTY